MPPFLGNVKMPVGFLLKYVCKALQPFQINFHGATSKGTGHMMKKVRCFHSFVLFLYSKNIV